MGQITLYFDPDTAEKMRLAAESAGVSQSKWVARLVREKLADSWPASVKQLAGAWPDFPSAEELRQTTGDLPREVL